MPLSPRMPELASFEVFLAIAETGSLGHAARELGLTQQAISRRLASTVTLAVRIVRGSQLTPAGLIVADECAARLLEVAYEIDGGLGLIAQGGAGKHPGGGQPDDRRTTDAALVALPAGRGDAPRRTAPQVILTATNSEHAIASVRDGTVDLGFVENPEPPKGLGTCVVAQDELVIVVSPPGTSGPDGRGW